MPTVKITFHKIDEIIRGCYTDEELKIFLKKPNMEKTTFIEFRTWEVIISFASTGCRVSTLINLKISDIDWENRLIAYAHTKNRKA